MVQRLKKKIYNEFEEISGAKKNYSVDTAIRAFAYELAESIINGTEAPDPEKLELSIFSIGETLVLFGEDAFETRLRRTYTQYQIALAQMGIDIEKQPTERVFTLLKEYERMNAKK